MSQKEIDPGTRHICKGSRRRYACSHVVSSDAVKGGQRPFPPVLSPHDLRKGVVLQTWQPSRIKRVDADNRRTRTGIYRRHARGLVVFPHVVQGGHGLTSAF